MPGEAPLRIAAVEPYFGGSHRHFLEDLSRFTAHRLELYTLPARMWKWRVRGAALHLARQLNATTAPHGFDAFLCSDFVNLPDLRALLDPSLRSVPVLYYMHENQLGYPLSPDEEHDPYFGFTNVLSCLSADSVAFNSDFHRRDFLAKLPAALPRLPDYEPRWVIDTITAKAEVLPIGLDVAALDALRPLAHREHGTGAPPRILWNHRWEFDKRPERFFAALEALSTRDVPFAVDIAGESFARRPAVFDTARAALGERVGIFGWIESRAEYVQLLWGSDIVVSTANQEYFGISMAEAVACGAFPIAPRALVYVDLFDGPCATRHLYRDDDELVRLLERATSGEAQHECPLAARMRDFDWRLVALRFDARFRSLAGLPS